MRRKNAYALKCVKSSAARARFVVGVCVVAKGRFGEGLRELGPAEWTRNRYQSWLATLVKRVGSAQRVAGSAPAGARELRARKGGCKCNAVEPGGRPKKTFLIADDFNSFQPTVGPKRSVTVKA